MRRTAIIVGVLVIASGIHAGTASDLTSTAHLWLDSLDADQRQTTLYSFEDDERFDLRLAPLWLEGLRRDKMTNAQWVGWREVLAASLSDTGVQKVERVISLEREVRARDQESWSGRWFGSWFHGEQRYYVSIFGEPRPGHAWGARFDGHHLSLNWTVSADGALSATPLFMGSEPREVSAGRARAGLRVLAAEEDAGVSLWDVLDAEQQERAQLEFAFASGPGGGNRPLFLGAGERVQAGTPLGIARSELNDRQRERLDALVEVYLANQTAEVAAARRTAIDAAGRDSIHFAWAGSLTPGEAGYYRVQGPTFLIEFDNTMQSADHVHTIFREFTGDFGRDVLAEHYAREHTLALSADSSGR